LFKLFNMQLNAYMVVHGWSCSNEHPGDIAVCQPGYN
jgi:hypothetical protein